VFDKCIQIQQMDDVYSRLEAEYCPPIDSALLSAIVSDYDLHDGQSLKDARSTLDALKATALEEEATDFDPSGSGAQSTAHIGQEATRFHTDTDWSPSNETDISSISNGLSNVDFTESSSDADVDNELDQNLDALDNETKVSLLKDVFSSTSDFTIRHTLKKCEYKWKPALDDLLNQVYLSEIGENGGERIYTKSIDAFSEDNAARRGRKGKKKGKNRTIMSGDKRSSSLPTNDEEPLVSSVNKWQNATKDVEFIASRTNIASSKIQSIYYRCNASTADTVATILKDSLETTPQITSSETAIQVNAVDLGHEFPTVPSDQLVALIRLTHPSTADAHELAGLLTNERSSDSRNAGSLKVIPVYARPQLSDDEYEVEGMRKIRASTTESSPASLNMATASGLAMSYSNARHAALAQAQAAYRRSRSDHLMAGVAGYYSQVGREHATASQKYNSAAADALVDSQSTAYQVDLHGVNVQDALRIARDRTENWWAGLGESRVNGRRGADDRARGFSIVVGVGRHSEGGKGKLGPAVSKMLAAEGWRVESGSGVIAVKGKMRNM